jgi:hypothetical protein
MSYKEIYNKALSKRNSTQLAKSFEIKERNTRYINQSKKLEAVRTSKYFNKLLCLIERN